MKGCTRNHYKLIQLPLLMLLTGLFFQVDSAFAVTASPKPIQYTQPDGSMLMILFYGDEFVHYATTVDGYTLLSNRDGFFEYAKTDTAGNLVLSGIRAREKADRSPKEKKWLRKIKVGSFFSESQVEAMLAMKKAGVAPSSAPSAKFPKSGIRKNLLILANFSNTATSYPPADFDNMMNQQGFSGTGSFRDYFLEVSYGQLTINTTVTVWVTLPNPHDYYGPVANWREFAFDAISAADAQAGIDFSQFDNDNDGVADGITILHQGTGQEASANINDIWAHKWDLSSAGYTAAQRTFDGVLTDIYCTGPELLIPGTMTNIGVFCHEFGHVLGSPDFYDTDQNLNGLYVGTGLWDLMGSGNWNGNYGTLPAHPNAWIKNHFNWTNPVKLNNQQIKTLRNAQLYPEAVRYNSVLNAIYFLCENRQQTGFDAGLPGHGLLIYYVDSMSIIYESGSNQVNHDYNQSLYPMSAISTTVNGVMLSPGNINTDGCPWPGSGLKTEFTDFTIPSSIVATTRKTVKPLLNITENVSLKEASFCFLSCNPDGPGSFSATPNSPDKIDLNWTNNSNNDPTLIAYSFYPFIETPVPGQSYSLGNILTFYSQVIFNGPGTTFQHIGVNANTTYYYSAWSVLPGNNYSYTLTGRAIIYTNKPPCPGIPSMTINHTVSGGVAPVDKSVVYGTVTEILGEPSKCWITSNLGSTKQPDSIDDPAEASAGWYWQFDHKQGYKHDGTTRTPGSAWNSSIMTNDDWHPENDPCFLELGNHWRIPTMTEWTNLENGGHWRYGNGHWYSGLKLHFAGFLLMDDLGSNYGGDLVYRGFAVNYWSKSNIGINFYGAFMLNASFSSCQVVAGSGNYPTGLPLRCVRESPVLATITTAAVGNITGVDATSGGTISTDGGLPVTSRGVCWSLLPNPTLTDNHTVDGTGTGSFISNITGLTPLTTYHVRAYATNNIGTAFGNDLTFTTGWGCGSPLAINHVVSGGVAPVNKQTSYGTVKNLPGEPDKCWITSNLGSDHQATAVDDATEASAGWYWEFNRKQGFKHDGITRTPNTPWVYPIVEDSDWLPDSDPCTSELGIKWRIPTSTEWANVDAGGNWMNWTGPWNSSLKLHAAGGLNPDGSLFSRGFDGHYHSRIQSSTTHSYFLIFWNVSSYVNSAEKSGGWSLRCLFDECPTYSNIDIIITPSKNPACEGELVTFTAAAVGGGTSPVFQWKVNGSLIGGNTPAFSYNPANNDQVTCTLTSNQSCITGNIKESNLIMMIVHPNPLITLSPCLPLKTYSLARPFTLTGFLPNGGSFSGSGYAAPDLFDPSITGAGVFQLTFSYTNVYGCAADQNFQVQVSTQPVFTCGASFADPRDGQSYPTFIGPDGKCWMASNLNYGTQIPLQQTQSDNCLPEKHCLQNLQANCALLGGLYQWDELMWYENQPGLQDLCPPGWHVPSETEWQNLVDGLEGNGKAGINLKDQFVAPGFMGILSGFGYQDNAWNAISSPDSGSLYWTSTRNPSDPNKALSRGIHQLTPSVSVYKSLHNNSHSVRCVKN
jgi:M6 family metalloprotease-like protein/uncharacterized protein (TIGR02145 family)